MDEEYMHQACVQAYRGRHDVAPNPLVGACIVKDDAVIATGYHARFGSHHAEIDALKEAGDKAHGATLYVTLEPCCHHGKQPPCTDAIIKAGIAKVVIGSLDPNPLVNGGGCEALRQAGIEVIEGIGRDECIEMNRFFFHHILSGYPYVTVKYAMTSDGKIACYTGNSRWISCEESREHVHQQRSIHQAIMVGISTVIADDPLLTSRIDGGRNPLRVICDSSLRLDMESQVVKTAHRIPTVIATCCQDISRWKSYEDAGCQIIACPRSERGVDLPYLMGELGKRGINSVYIEGGGQLIWSAFNEELVNRVHCYLAPLIVGGSSSPTPVSGQGVDAPEKGYRLERRKVSTIGRDLFIESEVSYVHGAC